MDDLDVKAPAFQQIDEGHYRLTIEVVGLQFDIDRLRRERHELIGELTVACSLAGARTVDGVLSVGSFNLSSPTTRSSRAKLLREQSDSELDFSRYLEELCQRTIAAERTGSPAKPLQTFERPGPDAEHDVDGWRLLLDHPTIGFGDGGSAKSYLALYGAGVMAKRGVQVLLADWELSGGDHHDRLVRLFGDVPPTVHYLRCERPLIDEAERIKREVRRLSIDYLICDSIAPAAGGPPEAAEHATAYFRAIRQIGIGSLHLAHVTKSEGGDQKPFGSSFWHNLARATFFIKQAGVSPDGRQVSVGVFQRKANLGPVRPAIGFQFTFDNGRTAVSRIDLAHVEGLASQLPTWQRMKAALRSGALSVPSLAEQLEVTENTIRQALKRDIDRAGKQNTVSMFSRVDGGLIGLAERRVG